jgi:hypothetical protein
MGGWEWAIPQSQKISLAADALLTALRGTEIYNMGKLLNDGLDLTPAKGQKEKF